MKNKIYALIVSLVFVFLCILIIDKSRINEDVTFLEKKDVLHIFNNVERIDLNSLQYHTRVTALEGGYDIYSPSRNGYRYGPSIIYNEDGSLDMWFSSPGNNSTKWDYIRYRHLDCDGNWSKEEIVLTPDNNSLDHFSVCDPGVIYFNGYYYLGYTSTTNEDGYDNNVFVCRSENPNGPFEKWDGEDWGGKPVPIIEFDEDESYWGAGEISFCIKEDKLYCYYSWEGEEGYVVKVMTADLCDDWPNTLEYQGIAFYKGSGEDSCDVVYVEEYDMFLAFAIEYRLSSMSKIVVYESYDGFNFNKATTVEENVVKYAHNIGISKRLDGSIDLNDDLYISYAYDKGDYTWGKWYTYFQPIEIEIYLGTSE